MSFFQAKTGERNHFPAGGGMSPGRILCRSCYGPAHPLPRIKRCRHAMFSTEDGNTLFFYPYSRTRIRKGAFLNLYFAKPELY